MSYSKDLAAETIFIGLFLGGLLATWLLGDDIERLSNNTESLKHETAMLKKELMQNGPVDVRPTSGIIEFKLDEKASFDEDYGIYNVFYAKSKLNIGYISQRQDRGYCFEAYAGRELDSDTLWDITETVSWLNRQAQEGITKPE